jgi:bifunctional non-homologous end joining protein LigD
MITPMLAHLVRESFDREDWLFELKWDGFRAIAERGHGGHVSLYSRNQNDFKKRFPSLVEALAALKRPVILDGENRCVGHPRPLSGQVAGKAWKTARHVGLVFDLLMLDGKDLRHLPLLRRKQRLARLLTGHSRVLVVECIPNDGRAMFAGALGLGVEGVVAKDGHSPMSKDQYKRGTGRR